MGSNQFAEKLVEVMLSWMRLVVNWFWAVFRTGAPSGLSKWFAGSWKGIVVTLILVGVVVDWLVWMIRWRPYWLWFRKKVEEGRQETEYEIHGEPRHAIADYLHRRIKPLDLLRNLLLVLAFVLILVPGELTGDLTPRIACVPLFLCLIPVKIAENMRKALGEHKRK